MSQFLFVFIFFKICDNIKERVFLERNIEGKSLLCNVEDNFKIVVIMEPIR